MTEEKDYVFNQNESGKITSLGYAINSHSLNKTLKGGSGGVNLFEDLSIPIGFGTINPKQRGGFTVSNEINNDKIISDDLYEKLLKMVEVVGGGKKTKKREDKPDKRKTKKNRR